MKSTLNQSIAVSNSIPPTISNLHACYLLFFLDNRCEIAALKKQFALTPLQVVEFLTSKSVRAAIEEMHETIRASLAVQALKARDFAMDKLKLVCDDLTRQTAITSGAPINEALHAKAINHLRLATSQLGRFAAAAIAPARAQRKTASPLEHHLSPGLTSVSPLLNSDLAAEAGQYPGDFASNPSHALVRDTQNALRRSCNPLSHGSEAAPHLSPSDRVPDSLQNAALSTQAVEQT